MYMKCPIEVVIYERKNCKYNKTKKLTSSSHGSRLHHTDCYFKSSVLIFLSCLHDHAAELKYHRPKSKGSALCHHVQLVAAMF